MLVDFTARDLINWNAFQKFAEEASDAEKLLKSTYSFSLGQTEIQVFRVERLITSYDKSELYCGNATLTVDGKWHYTDNSSGGRSWVVDCSSVDGIFKCLRAKYLKDTCQEHLIPESELELADVADNFRKFIEELNNR